MKKFYDIKPKSEKPKMKGLGLKSVERPNYFWDDENSKIIPQKKKKTKNSRLKKALLKSLPIILILLLLFSFALARAIKAKNDIDSLTKNLKNHLNDTFSALNSGDIAEAMSSAEKSSNEIKQLRLNLQSWGQDMSSLDYISYKKSKLTNIESLLKAADLSLSSIVELRQQIGSGFSDALSRTTSENSALGEIQINFNNDELESFFTKTDKTLNQSIDILDNIDPNSLAIDNFNLEGAKNSIKKLKSSIYLTSQILTEDIPWLTGDNGEKNILILFVNNDEIRGGGGFIGSYAIAKFKNKTLNSLDFQSNIYKVDNAFTAANIVDPPQELAYVNQGRWSLRDANYALDFPETAAKVKEFYQLETGKKVDGVISMDTTLITEMLKITGPINMSEYNLEINSDNFNQQVEYEVEQNYFARQGGKEENEPKKILADMMPRFINKILDNFSNSEKLLPTMAVFSKAVSEKHLVLQFDQSDFQQHLNQIDYSGKISGYANDFLMISNTNLGGGKSSQKVTEKFIYKTEIKDDGSQSSSLEIERKHNGTGEWPDGYNKNLLRILVPKGSNVSQFIQLAGNFLPLADEKYKNEKSSYQGEEAGYGKWSFWMNTEPGETSKASMEYSLPLKYNLSQNEFYYVLNLEKQLGSGIDQYSLQITYPKEYVPVNVENFDSKNRLITINDKLDQDKEYKIKFKKI